MKVFGKEFRVRNGIITISTIAAIGLFASGMYTLIHDNDHKAIENTNEDDINNENNNEELTYEELELAFVNYYGNTNDEYVQTLDENVYGYMAINNLTGAEIENIFGRNVPTTLELEKGLTNFFSKAFYNYTYATEPSELAAFVRNEDESSALADVESQLAAINEQQMNDELSKADIKALKKSIKEIMTNDNYSLGLKAYVANTICFAFELIVSDSKYAFTDAEAEVYHGYATDYECATLAEQLVGARDDSLVEHGAEIVTVTDDEAFIGRLRTLVTNLKKYPSTFADLDEMEAREIISSIEEAKNSGGKSEQKSSSGKSTKEEVSKDEMTDGEKKQAEADEKAIEGKIDENNEAKEKRAKDRGKKIEAAVQSVSDGIASYIYGILVNDASLLNDNFKINIKAKTKDLIEAADDKTGYNIYDDVYERLYNEDGNMTEMMQNMVINCMITPLTEYSKHKYITTQMAMDLAKYSDLDGLVDVLRGYYLIQDPQISVVPGLEGTYDPSTNYTKDANGNKIPVNPTTAPTPTPGVTPSAVPTPTPVPGITYYPIPTPPVLDFSKNSSVDVFENYCSANDAAVITDIAHALNYTYGNQAALNYLYEVRDIAVSYAEAKLQEVSGNVISKC